MIYLGRENTQRLVNVRDTSLVVEQQPCGTEKNLGKKHMGKFVSLRAIYLTGHQKRGSNRKLG